MNDPMSDLSQRVTQSLGEVVGETRSTPPGLDAIHGAAHRRRQKRLVGMGACLSVVLVAGLFGASSFVGNGGDQETVVVAAEPTTEAVEVDRPTSTASAPTPETVVVAAPDGDFEGDDSDDGGSGDGDSPLASWEFPLSVSTAATPQPTSPPAAAPVATATAAPAPAPQAAAPTATVAAPTPTQIPVELATPVQVTPTSTPTVAPTPVSCELGIRDLTLAEARAVEEACTHGDCDNTTPIDGSDDNTFSDGTRVRLEVVECVANTPVPVSTPTPSPTEAVELATPVQVTPTAPSFSVSCQVGAREVSLAEAQATRASCEISEADCTDVIRSVSFEGNTAWPVETMVTMEVIEILCQPAVATAPTEVPVELGTPVQVTPTPMPVTPIPTVAPTAVQEELIGPAVCMPTGDGPDCIEYVAPNPDGSCPAGSEPADRFGTLGRCGIPLIQNSSPDDDLVGGG